MLSAVCNRSENQLIPRDWWREPRAEFSLTRVIVGDEILATYGKPDPGTADHEVVATARAERIA